MLAGNIIDHPDEEKYHRFKPTNTTIRKKIVDPKGTLEYAVEVRAVRPRLSHREAYITSLAHPARIQTRGKLFRCSSFPTLRLILEIGRRLPTVLYLPQDTLE